MLVDHLVEDHRLDAELALQLFDLLDVLVDHLVEDHRLDAELALQLVDLLDVLADHLVEDHWLDVAGIHFHLVYHWVVEVVVMACLNPTMLRRMR